MCDCLGPEFLHSRTQYTGEITQIPCHNIEQGPHIGSRAIKENLKWLCKQIDIFVKRKRLEITNMKPGAVYSTDPKIVLVCMLKRPLVFPRNCSMERALSVRNRFNQALNEVPDDFGLNVLSIESCDSPRFFDNLGGLNQMGKEAYFREINSLLAKFDKKKVKLLPKCYKSSPCHASSSSSFYGDRNAAQIQHK